MTGYLLILMGILIRSSSSLPFSSLGDGWWSIIVSLSLKVGGRSPWGGPKQRQPINSPLIYERLSFSGDSRLRVVEYWKTKKHKKSRNCRLSGSESRVATIYPFCGLINGPFIRTQNERKLFTEVFRYNKIYSPTILCSAISICLQARGHLANSIVEALI